MAGPYLTELQRVPTSDARPIEAFELDGYSFPAVPQLAVDVPATPAHINGGSDTDLLLFSRAATGYELFQRLSTPGGKDAEFLRIGDRAFPARKSPLLCWNGAGLCTTNGGTDVTAFRDEHGTLVAVANSLGPEIRFATDSVVYRFHG